jgi:hypothetical protein
MTVRMMRLIVVAFLSATCQASAAEDPSTSGLVGWWKLNESGGLQARDSSGNGYHGTLVGKPTWRREGGAIGGALEFDGTGDYVVIGNQRQFDITDEITVAAWIKVNRFDRNWQAIVGKGDLSWRIARDRDRDCLQFAFNSVPNEQLLKGQIIVTDGQWHHVAGVYDGRQMSLYIDGQLDVSQATTTNIPVSDKPVYIGENSQARGRYWNGRISDVRVYRRALTPQEIAALSRKGSK